MKKEKRGKRGKIVNKMPLNLKRVSEESNKKERKQGPSTEKKESH
jgi:hypothetical protein